MKKFFSLMIALFMMTSNVITPLNKLSLQTSVSIMDQAAQEKVEFVHVYFTALSGNFHDIIIPISKLESALDNGLKYDGSSIPGCSNIFASDMHLAIDLQSFFVNPKIKNQPKTARIFADVYQDEVTPYPADPRYMLKQAIKQAATQDYKFFVGPEIEFFLVEKNSNGELIPWDHGNYCGVEMQQKHESIKFEMMQVLLDNGINLEKLHHEVSPGQHEIVIQYNDPLTIADHIMLAKHLIKQVAGNYGIIATFMPKPFFGVNGSGMHLHFSLAEKSTGWNVFFDENDSAFLSPLAHNFLAGVLNRIQDATVIVNSCVNSFKRLVIGYEAPVYVCWAKKNRSALIRIPQINASQPYAARAEIRCADALCNPYLACTFLLKAGLEGIKNNEQVKPAVEENLFKLTLSQIQDRGITALPSSLQQAITMFEQSSNMHAMFDPIFMGEYAKLKQSQATQFARIVTDWELENYV